MERGGITTACSERLVSPTLMLKVGQCKNHISESQKKWTAWYTNMDTGAKLITRIAAFGGTRKNGEWK